MVVHIPKLCYLAPHCLLQHCCMCTFCMQMAVHNHNMYYVTSQPVGEKYFNLHILILKRYTHLIYYFKRPLYTLIWPCTLIFSTQSPLVHFINEPLVHFISLILGCFCNQMYHRCNPVCLVGSWHTNCSDWMLLTLQFCYLGFQKIFFLLTVQ